MSLVSAVSAANAHALSGLQAYWNMDAPTLSGKLPANAGHQAASLTESFVFFDFGTATENPIPAGTSLNMVGAPPGTNRAVGFTDPLSGFLAFEFRMENFDFSDLYDVKMTFAIENYTLAIASAFRIETRIGDGGWDSDYAELITGTGDYQLATIDFGSDLNYVQEPVDIRIRYVAFAEGVSYLNIDNIQVNAVPEPAAYGLIFGAGALGMVFLRRRLKR